MKKVNIASMAVISLSLLSNVYADGLSHDVDELQLTTGTLIETLNSHSASISDNTSAISVNVENISSNSDAINIVSSQVAVISAPAIYDYKNYTTNVSSKTFSLQGDFGGCGETEQRIYARTINGSVTNLKLDRIRMVAGNICHYKGFNYELSESSKKLVSKENYDSLGNLYSTDILGKPFTLRTSSMIEGKSFGGATGVKNQVIGGTPVLITAFVNTTTVERVQDVTVPAGTFTGCLKIHTVRDSGVLGRFNRYSWHCKDVGEIKRTQIDPVTLTPRFWKLTSYTQ